MAQEAYNLGFPKVGQVGSCALLALVYNNKVYAANIGDSKGVICRYDKKSKKYECIKINHMLNANSKKE